MGDALSLFWEKSPAHSAQAIVGNECVTPKISTKRVLQITLRLMPFDHTSIDYLPNELTFQRCYVATWQTKKPRPEPGLFDPP